MVGEGHTSWQYLTLRSQALLGLPAYTLWFLIDTGRIKAIEQLQVWEGILHLPSDAFLAKIAT
jgi:hypothetical protein